MIQPLFIHELYKEGLSFILEGWIAEIWDFENESMKRSLWNKPCPWAIGYAGQESLSSMPCFLMNGYHWFFSARVCTCGGDASPWRLCVLTAALRSWCMSLEVFCTVKAWVKLVLCCVQLSCPNISREMVGRKDWFSATVSSFHPFPACFYLQHLVITFCCNGLCWVWSVLRFVVQHSEGQTLSYSTTKNIYSLDEELKFSIILSLWLRVDWKENNSSVFWEEMCIDACVCMYVCMCS